MAILISAPDRSYQALITEFIQSRQTATGAQIGALLDVTDVCVQFGTAAEDCVKLDAQPVGFILRQIVPNH